MREDPDWVRMAAQAHICYRVPGMDRVAIRRNLSYKTTGDEPLPFDIYTPPEEQARPVPAVILIHGGPIPSNLLTSPKDWGLFHSFGRLLGASGLAAIMFNHRFFALEHVRTAMADVQDLVSHVTTHAETLGVDPDRLCIWVFSGGGFFLSPFLRDAPPAIRCLVAYYAVLHAPVPEFSPAAQIAETSGQIPPLLIARAGLDMPELNEGLDHFVQQALAKNASVDLLNHASGQHGFDCLDDNERTRDILRRTIEFIRMNLMVDALA